MIKKSIICSETSAIYKKTGVGLLLLIVLSCLSVKAQQLPLSNQYLVNKFSLSPAYAGVSEGFEAFIGYRKNWLGVSGAPESRSFDVNGQIFENMGIGGTIAADQVGIFRTFTATLSYAYHLKVAADQTVSFGLSAGLAEDHADLTASKSENLTDPIAINNQNVKEIGFDASFGLLYRYKKINFGIVIPRLLESKINDDNDVFLYKLTRHYRIHASYQFEINKDWQVEPFVVINKSANSDVFYEVAPLVKYKQMVWLSPTYRKGSAFAINLGGIPYKNFVVNYTYEFCHNGILGSSSGTHEISIGYLMGEKKSDVPAPSTKKPYYEWLEK